MGSCTFFGHRNIPKGIDKTLQKVLIDLIENKNVNLFYVGNNGDFDDIVRKNLKLLKLNYPHINYSVVLAYMPYKKDGFRYKDYTDTIYPNGLENTPPKYAIVKRNKWMLNQCDYVVTYVKQTFGGAAQFKELALKKEKL